MIFGSYLWMFFFPFHHNRAVNTKLSVGQAVAQRLISPGPLLAQIFAVRRLLQGDPSEFCLMGFETEAPQAWGFCRGQVVGKNRLGSLD